MERDRDLRSDDDSTDRTKSRDAPGDRTRSGSSDRGDGTGGRSGAVARLHGAVGNRAVQRHYGAGVAVDRSVRSTGGQTVQRAAGEQSFETCQVSKGDTLWGIADTFAIEGGPEQVAAWNDMAVDDPLYPGDGIRLPADRLGGDGGGSGGAASGAGGAGGAGGAAASGGGGATDATGYTVQRGESLPDLAEKHGVSVAELKQANPGKLRNWNGVEGFVAGATIVVPASGSAGDRASGSRGDEGATWDEIGDAWQEAEAALEAGATWVLDHLREGAGGSGAGGGEESGGETKKPSWIGVAEGESGTKEFGKYDVADDEWSWSKEQIQRSNPEVKKYFDAMGYLPEGLKHRGDHIPWCGAFVYYCVSQAGYKGARLGGKASNWEGWGKKLRKPVYGAVAVVKGGGHVGFVVGKSGSSLQLLGGNQGDAVNVSSYSAGSATYYGVPSGFDTATAPPLGETEAREGGDTR